eukprot:1997673-Heterocapsa_arctica.AAC.1
MSTAGAARRARVPSDPLMESPRGMADLDCGSILAVRISAPRGWWEAVVLIAAGRSSFVVVDSLLDLYLLDLGSTAIEWVMESDGHPRPIRSLAGSGEFIDSAFRDGP